MQNRVLIILLLSFVFVSCKEDESNDENYVDYCEFKDLKDEVENLKKENEKLKYKIDELEDKNQELESEIEDIKDYFNIF
ncbi:hypothetical protein [Fusobacterium animalis]|uniref:Uncharacterized protein n=1 Tax=Fusobacterium animalis TaxID=76859 RepID=A0A0M4RNJ7_9FUSO|nr:hypothetical protein [Fusobacterium animalis]ALF17422.1 hypothetical protein RN98_04275 [Fusobacterium animalis]